MIWTLKEYKYFFRGDEMPKIEVRELGKNEIEGDKRFSAEATLERSPICGSFEEDGETADIALEKLAKAIQEQLDMIRDEEKELENVAEQIRLKRAS
jgi:hypothetical protein